MYVFVLAIKLDNFSSDNRWVEFFDRYGSVKSQAILNSRFQFRVGIAFNEYWLSPLGFLQY